MRNYGYPSEIANQSLGQAPRPQPTAKTIPFDYVFQFDLNGKSGNKVQDVIEISMEGVFVALSVGYSLVRDEQKALHPFGPVFNERTDPPIPVFIPGFTREDPPLLERISITHAAPDAEIFILNLTESPPKAEGMTKTDFDGVGEIPGLSIPINGTVALRAWDRTNNLLGQPFVVDFPSTPIIGGILFDKTVLISGIPKSQAGSNISIFRLKNPTEGFQPEGSFLLKESGPRTRSAIVFAKLFNGPLSPGDVLLVRTEDVTSSGGHPFSIHIVPRPKISTITLGELAAGLERIGADLTTSFRLSPDIANLGADIPLDQLAPGTLDKAFQTGSVGSLEEVSFLYSIDVTGSGREYQNKAIHNIAGLGIANGDRPFRPFAKPVTLEPRSSIRIQVEEISGPAGTLYIVLQGYKMLGTGGATR